MDDIPQDVSVKTKVGRHTENFVKKEIRQSLPEDTSSNSGLDLDKIGAQVEEELSNAMNLLTGLDNNRS